MRKNTSGFTIVELLVVIAIIGILTTISVISYAVIQANSRDSQRSSKITVIAEALEKYYDKNGEYPSCAAMSAAANTVASSTLKGIDPNALSTPSAASGTNSILAACASLTAGSDAIAYVGDSSSACTVTDCLQYTLQYRQESTGNIISINSRRRVDIATSGDITNLAVTGSTGTQISLGWSAVSNTTSYNVQRATNNTFTSGLVEIDNNVPSSITITGLTAGTIYYFRVIPNSASGLGNWSNIVSASILVAPVASASSATTTQAILTWNAISLAQTYTVNASTSSSFTSPIVATGIAGTSYTFNGLAQNTTYYFRVEAINSYSTSSWSNTATAKTHDSFVATSSITNSTNSFPATVAYNSGGYTGTLTQNGSSFVSSGTYTPPDTKSVSVDAGAFTVEDWCWWAGGSMWYDHDSGYPASTYAYNSGGYVGTLSLSWYETSGVLTQYAYYDWDAAHLVNNTGYYNTKHHYMQGTYSGNATKPASDTRQYTQNYSGTVTN